MKYGIAITKSGLETMNELIYKCNVQSLLRFLALLAFLLLLGSWNTTFADDDVSEDFIEFLVFTDSSEDVVGDESLLFFLFLAGVGFFEYFFNYLLEDCSHVNWSIR